MGTLNLSSGTITGLNAGGLPDGCVQAADLASGVGGKFASYAVICDQKANNTDGGTITANAWRVRDLNTEITDPDGIVSISSNQFTLGAGTYFIRWSAPTFKSHRHISKLYDITGTADLAFGTTAFGGSSEAVMQRSFGFFRHTISGNNVYEIRHWVENTDSGQGGGVAFGDEDSTPTEMYTVVEIFKEAS